MVSGKEKQNSKTVFLVLIFVLILVLFFAAPNLFRPSPEACVSGCTSLVFTNPDEKLAELSSDGFTMKLFTEALYFEPMLNKSGTQVHMGFWSGKGNHGNLVRLLDSINGMSVLQNETMQKAIWDEGPQSSLQYPEYVLINSREAWYDRASATNGSAVIYGIRYTDPYNVSFKMADDIWGEYSKRYADMARLISKGTGKPVQVWCFVQGARENRIFYTYEYPELVELEQEGVLVIHFAKTPDADWRNPEDWYFGAANITNAGITN